MGSEYAVSLDLLKLCRAGKVIEMLFDGSKFIFKVRHGSLIIESVLIVLGARKNKDVRSTSTDLYLDRLAHL